MTNRVFVLIAWIVTGIGVAVLAYYLFQIGLDSLAALVGDFRQLVVAAAAAVIMGAVGFSLTMGRGTLAAAGQQEKIAVWAALLMSIVSAITTSSGLLLVLSPNPQTGAILMVGMALLLGVGIQLSMLMYALRIGDSVQRLSPMSPYDDVAQARDDGAETSTGINGQTIALVILLLAVGGVMIFGGTLYEFLLQILNSIYDGGINPTEGQGPRLLGLFFLIAATFMAVQRGLINRPGSVLGLIFSLGIYGALLLFSSGFGYVSYFLASQSEAVQAIDRDNVIRNETAALINRINTAARDDTRDFLLKARSGADFDDLSARIDQLSDMFVANRSKLDEQVAAFENRRKQVLEARERAASSIEAAEVRIAEAKTGVERAKIDLQRAQDTREANREVLEQAVVDADKAAIEAAEGRDGTGIAKCGPNCRAAQARAEERRAALAALDTNVQNAQLRLSEAERAVTNAERALETAQTSAEPGVNLKDPPPPVVVDRLSFVVPRNEYISNPSRDGLVRIAQTCATARDMLSTLPTVTTSTLPNCDISNVEVWLVRHADAEAALARMEAPCARTPEEEAQEAEALRNRAAPNNTVIPLYLAARQEWVTRCLTAANTGSDRMNVLARDASRLESEYFSPGFDTRRTLRSLLEGNLFSAFAALMAIIVDTAILFAGFAANAYKARSLGQDHRFVAPDKVADRVRMALSTVNPAAPHVAAQQVQMLSEPRTHGEVNRSPFTHQLSVAGRDPKVAAGVSLIMDAAGPAFARFVEINEARYWLLHHNFVSLITEHATTQTPQTENRAWGNQYGDAGVMGLAAAGPAGGMAGVRPIFDRAQSAMPSIPKPAANTPKPEASQDPHPPTERTEDAPAPDEDNASDQAAKPNRSSSITASPDLE